MTAPTVPAPGYYADPLDPAAERWWDGSAWTETVRPADAAVPAVEPDPLPAVEPEFVPTVQADPTPALEPDPMPVATAPAVPVAVPADAARADAEPSPVSAPAVPAGLYPDPYGQAPLRWWDGEQWTTQTSRPVPAQTSVAEPAAASNPAGVPSGAGGSTVLPAAAPAAAHRARPSRGLSLERAVLSRLSLDRIKHVSLDRATLAAFASRFSRKSLAGVLVVALAIGVRVYFLVDGDEPDAPAPSAVAAALNLRPGDLPKGWTVQRSTAGAAAADPGDAALDRDLARCTGAPDRTTALAYTAGSPGWTRGSATISSDVSVLRTSALAAQDLRAQRGPKGTSCVTSVAAPRLKRSFAAKGITMSGLIVSRLPDAAADGFALRMKLTLSSRGRTVTVYNDAYGFVRGNVEVSLTQVSTGGLPDRAAVAQALKQLRSRTVTAVPAH